MIDFERIKQTKAEDLIFIIYYIIVTISLYANYVERVYLFNNDLNVRSKYRTLLYVIYGTAFLVYLYYVYDNIKTLKKEQDMNTRRLNELSLIASLLVLISGLIYLYIIYQDKEVNIELAFN